MFEQSLVTSAVSGGRGLSRRGSIVAFSVGVQAALVTAFLVGPLLWPAALPKSLMTPHMTSVSLSKPVVKVQPKPQVVQTNTSATAMPVRMVTVEAMHGGSMRPLTSTPIGDGPSPVMVGNATMGADSLFGLGVGKVSGPAVSVAAAAPAKPAKAPTISSGVMAGRLLAPIHAVYPPIAIAAHQQGAVVVTATIDRNGRIVGLQVLSGPALLRGAAVDAVQEARYRPYLLNGEPTDVVTTITVNFQIGG